MYHIEIDVQGDDVSHIVGKPYFLCTDILVTHGETLEECLENATIGTQNQDGGSGPDIALFDLPKSRVEYYSGLIEYYFYSQKGE